MKFAVLLLILIAGQAMQVEGATDAYAFTQSELTASGTDSAVVRTLSNNLVSTPDLFFQGTAAVTSTIETNTPEGGGKFVQGLYFSAQQSGSLSGISIESRAFEWTGVTEVRTTIMGSVITAVSDPRYNPEVQRDWVESSSSGMTITSAGTDDYELVLSGGHETFTNAIPVRKNAVLPAGFVKEYEGSFELYPVEMDTESDLFDESIDFSFGINEMDQVNFKYDFSRELEIEDINCKSDMTLLHLYS